MIRSTIPAMNIRSLFFLGVMASAFAFSGCKYGGGDAIPASLDAKRKLLAQKQSELQELKHFIRALQDSIEAQSPRKVEGQLVTARIAKPADLTHYVDVQANVASRDEAFVAAEFGGRILEVFVHEGDYVHQGAPIARLDDATIRAQIDKTENALALARDMFRRQKQLWQDSIGSEVRYLQAKNRVEQLEKTLEMLKINLGKVNVTAPRSGVIERLMLKTGELAAPGRPIAKIINTHRLKIVAPVPEIYIGSLRTGQHVSITIPALGDKSFAGTIFRIGKTVNPANRTFDVEIKLHSGSQLLKPNMLAKVRFSDKLYHQVLALPSRIIRQDIAGKDFIMVARQTADGTVARRRIVTKGDVVNDRIIVTEGIHPGDTVLVDGTQHIADGDLIRVQLMQD